MISEKILDFARKEVIDDCRAKNLSTGEFLLCAIERANGIFLASELMRLGISNPKDMEEVSKVIREEITWQ